MRGHRCINLRQGIFGLVDRYSGIPLRLHPLHRSKRHHFHIPLHARKIFEIRGEGGKQLLLVGLQLRVGLIDREVKVSGQGGVTPWFSHFVVIAEGVVITRKHEDTHDCQSNKYTQAQDCRKSLETGDLGC